MEIKLSDHFTWRRLFRFVIPSIVMMVFISLYGVVDGYFVSNYAGKTAFAAVNLIWPFPMMLGSFGFMIGTGGSALVSMTLGQGRKEDANRIFSMLIKVTIIGGILLSAIGLIFIKDIAILLGATPEMLDYCVAYGSILLVFGTFFMLQNVFQSFMVTAEKPTLGLIVTVAAGVANMVLDFVLVGVLKGGIVGAGLATGISQLVGGLFPLIYFIRKNSSELRLIWAKIDFKVLGKTCFNGSSELMTNVSLSLVNMLYNLQLMKYAGEDGVSAYGVIMYVSFIFISVFIGYSIGTAPIVGFNYGANNRAELRNVYRKSLGFNVVCGGLMCVSAIAMSDVLSGIFVGYDAGLCEMTKRAFVIYSLSFIVVGINIFGSSFFTALGNGLISAILSFFRTLLFQVVAVFALPAIWGLDGVWFAIVTAELAALVLTVVFLAANRKKYGYGRYA